MPLKQPVWSKKQTRNFVKKWSKQSLSDMRQQFDYGMMQANVKYGSIPKEAYDEAIRVMIERLG